MPFHEIYYLKTLHLNYEGERGGEEITIIPLVSITTNFIVIKLDLFYNNKQLGRT